MDGYEKWWGRKNPGWFEPPKARYQKGGFEIGVNPELGLELAGHRHVIKMYLKEEALTRQKIDLITSLMNHCLASGAHANDLMCVLDVRRSKLIQMGTKGGSLMPLVDAELAY